MWEFCVECDYVYCYVFYYGYCVVVEVMVGFWKMMKVVGKFCNFNQVSFLQIVGIGEICVEVFKFYVEFVEYFY